MCIRDSPNDRANHDSAQWRECEKRLVVREAYRPLIDTAQADMAGRVEKHDDGREEHDDDDQGEGRPDPRKRGKEILAAGPDPGTGATGGRPRLGRCFVNGLSHFLNHRYSLCVASYLSLIHISEPTRQAEISYAV